MIDDSDIKIKKYEKELFSALKIDIQNIIEMIRVEDVELADYILQNMIIDEKDFTIKYVGDKRFNELFIDKIFSTPNNLMVLVVKQIKQMVN
jgi:hypothetical protein